MNDMLYYIGLNVKLVEVSRAFTVVLVLIILSGLADSGL